MNLIQDMLRLRCIEERSTTEDTEGAEELQSSVRYSPVVVSSVLSVSSVVGIY